mgnify:FL=1
MDRRWIRSIGLENVSFAFESRHFLLGLAVDLAPKRRFEARKVSHFTLRGIQGRSGPFGESMHSTLESISVRNICQMGTKKRLFMGLSHEKYWFFDDPQGTSHEVTLLVSISNLTACILKKKTGLSHKMSIFRLKTSQSSSG